MSSYIHKVQYYETDQMGVVHHSNYIRWMEEARVAFLEELGWPYDRLEREGVMIPVTALSCRYREPVFFSDLVRVETEVEEFRGVRLKIRYAMYRCGEKGSGAPVFTAGSEHCFTDTGGKLINLKRTNPEFFAVLTKLAEDGGDEGSAS